MTPWQQREGQTIDGIFPLLRYLGGGERSAVFLTEYGETNPRRAAIKLIPTGLADPDPRLAAWESASRLSHPHLIQIFAGGECQLEDQSYVYVVMECTDESLSEVVRVRTLTAQEAREMLRPVVDALGYLHGKGFVHGHLTPSNIMAVGEQVKITTDTVHQDDSPADDAWSLGVVLREALAPRMPGQNSARLPEPFAEIVRHCLDPDPQKRWSMAEISARLAGRESPAAPPPAVAKKPSRGPIAAVIGGAVIIALGAWLMRAPRTEPAAAPSPTATPVQPVAPVENVQPVEKPKAVKAPESPARGGILTQVLPDIPPKARNTINGKVIVNVKVSVDGSGNVQAATIAPPRSSRYLSERAVAAARRWKFEPGNAEGDWLLRFQLFRDHSTVSPARVSSK
jgi:TonB family protein